MECHVSGACRLAYCDRCSWAGPGTLVLRQGRVRASIRHLAAEPTIFADLTWPPGAEVRPDEPIGRRVFAKRCAVCHGPDGRGNGPAAPSMTPRPRDFTQSLFKYKSTIRTEPPTD